MEFIWIFFAFVCGLLAKFATLPPSIGYLIAGFVLHYFGFEPDPSLESIANLGITLMLFTIGLKLNIRELLKTEVWGIALSHSTIWITVTTLLLKIFVAVGLILGTGLAFETALLIAFALSFSSTVCVIKLLEDQGEMRSRHGKLAVGILVMQDIIAVIFLVVATGKVPSPWAISLLSLLLVKPYVNKLLNHVGHGELIPLTGFFLAFGGYELFNFFNIKGDLGALLVGMYFASHAKASEISKSLLNFKDLFLIGFFLMIGFTALPTAEMFGIALLLCLLLPIKFFLFYGLALALKIKARTAFLSALMLSNFSEFGLIVAAISVEVNWLSKEWLVIIALSVSMSFILTNICYLYAESTFSRFKEHLAKYERKTRLPEDAFTQPCNAPVVVLGMGRVGMGAYKALEQQLGDQVWGLDAERKKVDWLISNQMQVFHGDGEDRDFWDAVDLTKLKLVLIAVPQVKDAINITQQLRYKQYKGKIAAIARFDDERVALEKLGIDKVFNFYTEAGVGFAEESIGMIKTDFAH